MKRFALIAVLAAAEGIAATGAGCSAMTIDAGPPDTSTTDGNHIDPEAGALGLVVVNGMDQALLTLNDTNIRVCLGNSASDYPLPEDPSHPVPLSNYPGIPIGGGVDLGARALPPTMWAISAKLQSDNYPNSPNGSARVGCDKILGGGALGKPNVAIAVGPTPGNQAVVVLLDATGDAGATGVAALLDGLTHGPLGDGGTSIHAQVGAFGEWPQQTVTAEVIDPSDAAATLVSFDAQSVSSLPSVAIDLSTFDNRLRLTSGASTFEQSFQSIQSVSDPTTSASVFYGVRANFLFVLLGAQGDAATPSFGDRGLHIVAIPYVP